MAALHLVPTISIPENSMVILNDIVFNSIVFDRILVFTLSNFMLLLTFFFIVTLNTIFLPARGKLTKVTDNREKRNYKLKSTSRLFTNNVTGDHGTTGSKCAHQFQK